MLKNCRDRIYAEATEILDKELAENWYGKTHEDLRLNPFCYGFTSSYLSKSTNREIVASSAQTSVFLELAKLDLRKGTTLPELAFSCRRLFPRKDALQALIELGKETECEEKVVKSVFEYRDHFGYSWMNGLFDMARRVHTVYKKPPTGPMLLDIEECFFYFIDLAKTHNLDMDKVLNDTTKTGSTVFRSASLNSERISKFLLHENVKVNSIDHKFQTPSFRVRHDIFCRRHFFSSNHYASK